MGAPDKETLRTEEQEQPAGSPLALYVMTPQGGTRYLLRPGQLAYVGRSLDATIRVNDPGVSRLHALLNLAEPLTISDLGSSNGTFVAGERLDAERAARDRLQRGLPGGELRAGPASERPAAGRGSAVHCD